MSGSRKAHHRLDHRTHIQANIACIFNNNNNNYLLIEQQVNYITYTYIHNLVSGQIKCPPGKQSDQQVIVSACGFHLIEMQSILCILIPLKLHRPQFARFPPTTSAGYQLSYNSPYEQLLQFNSGQISLEPTLQSYKSSKVTQPQLALQYILIYIYFTKGSI